MESSSDWCSGAAASADAVPDQFPAGLRVLVVDDDMTCLRILEQMLHKCLYRVTICCRATKALDLLRERKGAFDIVISDVHMPDMDGFKLLELVGLEMDLPVIMMSGDGRTSAVMRGIKHGACDYLIKPVRIEELKNIWQHVIRKKRNGSKEVEHSGSIEDSDHQKRGDDDVEYASSVIDGSETSWKCQKKRKDVKEDDDGELENDDPSTPKKPRVVWSVELHQQFVSAVNQLGIDKAVPKRILDLMNVPGLTRENVASHLQKFRLYLKRLSAVAQHQSGLRNPFCTSLETNGKAGSVGRFDIQTLAASGQISPQTLASFHADVLGKPPNCLVLPTNEQPAIQALTQGPKCVRFDPGIAYGESILTRQSDLYEQFPQQAISVECLSPGISKLSSGHPDNTNNLAGANNVYNRDVLLQLPSNQNFPMSSESRHAINVQPSRLVSPSQSAHGLKIAIPISQSAASVSTRSSINFLTGNGNAVIKQNCGSSDSNKTVDCAFISSKSSNTPLGVGQFSCDGVNHVPAVKGYVISESIPSSMSSCAGSRDNNLETHIHNATINVSSPGGISNRASMFSTLGFQSKVETLPNHVSVKNFGFVGKGICIPKRFAVDDMDSSINEINGIEVGIIKDMDKAKQEHLDFDDAAIAGSGSILW